MGEEDRCAVGCGRRVAFRGAALCRLHRLAARVVIGIVTASVRGALWLDDLLGGGSTCHVADCASPAGPLVLCRNGRPARLCWMHYGQIPDDAIITEVASAPTDTRD